MGKGENKALFIIDSLGSGGAQRQMISVAKGLKARGIEVEFLVYFPEFDYFEHVLDDAGIFINKHQKRGRFDLNLVFAIRKLIVEKEFSAVLSFMLTPSLYAELACSLIPKSRRPRLCFSDRSTFEDDFTPTALFRLRHQSHRVANVITTNSESHKNKLVSLFPWMSNKARAVYNGVDLSLFSGEEQRPIEEPYLLSVSRVITYKNFVNLAEAMVLCKERGEKVPLVLWLGKAFDLPETQEQLVYVKSLLTKHGLEDRLRFLGEIRDVGTYYRHAEGLIHTSFIEGFSNAVAEGMCWGLPCLLGDISDHKLLLDQYQFGRVFSVHSKEEIADTLIWFEGQSKERKNEMGKNAKDAAFSLFDLEKAADTYKEILFP